MMHYPAKSKRDSMFFLLFPALSCLVPSGYISDHYFNIILNYGYICDFSLILGYRS